MRDSLAAAPAFDAALRLYSLVRRTAVEADVALDAAGVYVYVGAAFGNVGPAHVNRRVRLKRADGRVEYPGGFIIVSDIEAGSWRLTVTDLIREKYLAMTMAHEVGHRMLADLYTKQVDLQALSVSRSGHDVMSITDPCLALNEGWAESTEALIGDLLSRAGVHGWGEQSTEPSVRSMFRGRQDILKRDGYIWDKVGASDGETRNGLQMVASEGVVAYQLYQLMTQADFSSKDPVEGFVKLCRVMAKSRPRDLGSLMDATATAYPAFRQALVRMLHDWTKWTIYSNEGGTLYKNYRTAQLAFKRHQRKDDTAKELAAEFAEARQAYDSWKEKAAVEVVKRSSIAGPAVDPMWLDCGLSRVGLNLATSEQLTALFDCLWGSAPLNIVLAEKLTNLRDKPGGTYFRSVDELSAHVDDSGMHTLKQARGQFQSWSDSNAQVPTAAYAKLHPDRILTGRLARWKQEGGAK